jgi:hypothetical protein
MGISQIMKQQIILAALLAANAPALADPKFDYLPEAQALAIQRAIETGARLTPYDKQFLFWAALNLVNPDCGIVGAGEAQDLELMLTEAASGSLLFDPFLSVQAQVDFFSHALSMEKSPCHNEDGKKLLGEIAMVLTEDNKGSRADLGKMLEEMEILPKSEDIGGGQNTSQTGDLHKSDVVRFGRYNIDLMCISGANDGTEQVCNKVNELFKLNTVRTLRCVYGPFSADGTGFETYEFWHENPPEDLEAYRIEGRPHPFYRLGSAAVDACPTTNAAAIEFHKQHPL